MKDEHLLLNVNPVAETVPMEVLNMSDEEKFIRCLAPVFLDGSFQNGKSIVDVVKHTHGSKFRLMLDFSYEECSPKNSLPELSVHQILLSPCKENSEEV